MSLYPLIEPLIRGAPIVIRFLDIRLRIGLEPFRRLRGSADIQFSLKNEEDVRIAIIGLPIRHSVSAKAAVLRNVL